MRLTIYYPCSAETSRKSGSLNYPKPLGPPWPVPGHRYSFYRCGNRNYQFLWFFWDRFIKPAFRWCVHTNTSSCFCRWSSWPRLSPIYLASNSFFSHRQMALFGGAALNGLTVKSLWKSLTFFLPLVPFPEPMCSWQFVRPRCKRTRQPSLTRPYHQ